MFIKLKLSIWSHKKWCSKCATSNLCEKLSLVYHRNLLGFRNYLKMFSRQYGFAEIFRNYHEIIFSDYHEIFIHLLQYSKNKCKTFKMCT